MGKTVQGNAENKVKEYKMKNFVVFFAFLLFSCGAEKSDDDFCLLVEKNMDIHKCYLQGDYIDPELCRGDINDASVIGGSCYEMVYQYYYCKMTSEYPCTPSGGTGACSWYSEKIDVFCPKCWNITAINRLGINCQ